MTRLKKVYAMFLCTKDSHDNCISMRDAAMKSSKNIMQAYTTGVELKGQRYCVTCKALVTEDKLREFIDNLWKIRSATARHNGVKRLEVLVSK